MKPNKLTLGYNLRWESSRMMLPEHKEVLRRHQKELTKKQKPLLDEQQLELFSLELMQAMQQKSTVAINIFHPYETCTIKGEVEKISFERRELILVTAENREWILLDDILQVEIE